MLMKQLLEDDTLTDGDKVRGIYNAAMDYYEHNNTDISGMTSGVLLGSIPPDPNVIVRELRKMIALHENASEDPENTVDQLYLFTKDYLMFCNVDLQSVRSRMPPHPVQDTPGCQVPLDHEADPG